MCILVVKNYKYGKPLRAKSCIVVLGNFEDRLYKKLQRYALVLKNISLRLLTDKSVGDKPTIQQGNLNSSFCNSTLTDYEVTVIRHPIGNPALQDDEYWLLKKTLYGLRLSPHNWYNIIKGVLIKMGLNTSPRDTWLLSGVFAKPYSPDNISDLQSQLHVGLYVNNFVLYSSDPTHNSLFKTLLQ